MTVDRQALFSGTESPPLHLALDAQRIDAWLRSNLPGYRGPVTIEKFRGGQSNPTYKLIGPDCNYVLRRKPPGELLASAHAIDREFRVLSALHGAGFAVPRPHLYCDDVTVAGTPFYLLEYIEGRVFWNAELPGLTAAERTGIYDSLAAVLAQLHQFDFRALGLEDYGRPGSYLKRSLDRWSNQYRACALEDISDMEWLMRELRTRLPRAEGTALVHGDYGLYNVIIDPTQPTVLAVLDWEVSTIGDPLADLAWHTRPWWDPPDRAGGSSTSLVDLDLAELGIPSLERHLQSYNRRFGALQLENWAFYLGYSQFRYAAIIQGILKRARDGTGSNRTMLHTQDRVRLIAAMARRTLEEAVGGSLNVPEAR